MLGEAVKSSLGPCKLDHGGLEPNAIAIYEKVMYRILPLIHSSHFLWSQHKLEPEPENFIFWHEQGMKMYSVHLNCRTSWIRTAQFSGFWFPICLPWLGAGSQSRTSSEPYNPDQCEYWPWSVHISWYFCICMCFNLHIFAYFLSMSCIIFAARCWTQFQSGRHDRCAWKLSISSFIPNLQS